jgi:hypothetical protein
VLAGMLAARDAAVVATWGLEDVQRAALTGGGERGTAAASGGTGASGGSLQAAKCVVNALVKLGRVRMEGGGRLALVVG